MEKGPKENADQIDLGRRDAIRTIITIPIAAAVVPGVLLAPDEAKAFRNNLDYPVRTRTGVVPYNELVNQCRPYFGKRQDYRDGFEGAMSNSNRVVELPEGMYGILPTYDPSNPRAIDPGTEAFIERAGYLHATQEIDAYPRQHSRGMRKNVAEGKLNKEIERIIKSQYRKPGYDKTLLSRIRVPVVTLDNISQSRIEKFVRVPLPGTVEYTQMEEERWPDYYNQSRLKDEHPFSVMLDPTKTLYENLLIIYGPQLQALQNVSQQTKFYIGATISLMNSGTHAILNGIFRTRRTPARFFLTPAQIADLNTWLGLTGTPYEIR